MTEARRLSRVAALLGFGAALLAESAVVVQYLRTGTVDWSIAAAGMFIAAFALNLWTRARRDGPDQSGGT